VVSGAGMVSQQANRVEADLTSVERAGKRAESVAKEAEKAAKEVERQAVELTHSATRSLHRLASAVHLVQHFADRIGVPDKFSIVMDAGAEGFATSAHVMHLLGPLIGPQYALPIAGAVGLGSGMLSVKRGYEKKHEEEKRARE